jgi:hypothetical protein
MMGFTLGALVMAPRWTIPIRPHPITPTLISFTSLFSAVILKAVRWAIPADVMVKAFTLVAANATIEMIESLMVVYLLKN